MGSNKPLLEDHSLEDGDTDSDGLLGQEEFERRPFFDSRRPWAILSANVFVLLLNIGLLLMISAPPSWKPDDDKGPRLPHAEWIKPALQMELRSFNDKFGSHGAFRGPPRPELDNAWAEILRNYTVRIPQPGWRNATSPKRILTEFQDDRGGIMGTFSFLHNIHCIKEIREFMLPDYYPETATRYKPTVEEPIPVHIDHCLDILRQSELCHADMSLMVFEWHEDEDRPVDIHHAQHICANTEKLNSFLEANTVPPFNEILVHSWTGKSPFVVGN